MHTDQNGESVDTLHYAYGRRVQDLLSQSDAESWIEDLWQMYSGYSLLTQESGYDPKGFDRFVSFRELIFFFQDIGKMAKQA